MANQSTPLLILRFWQIPLFTDPEDQRFSKYLTRSVATGILIVFTVVILIFANPNTTSIQSLISFVVLCGYFFARYLLILGKFSAVSFIIALVGWLGVTVAVVEHRGIHQPMIVFYVVITIFVGYVISWRASLHVALLSISTLLVIAYVQATGVLTPVLRSVVWYDASIWFIGIMSALTTIRFGTERIKSALADVQAKNVELEKATAVADAANVAKSQFLANMSHEIRTPLNAIIGLTSLMMDTPINEEQEDYLQTMRVSGDGLLSLINDILDFSKIEAGKLEIEQQPFQLHGCVIDAINLFMNLAAEKQLALTFEIDSSLPNYIVGDVTRIRQILVNLLGNAIKFTGEGFVQLVVVGEKIEEGRLQLKFAIKDSGIGIPPDRMNRLFQSFSQVDSSTTKRFGGTGLGLAISQRLAKAMQGEMWVDSEPNVGSTFYFTIVVESAPQNGVHAQVDVVSETAVSSTHHQSGFDHSLGERLPLRILLAEDNPINQKVGLRILKRLGYQADVARNGLEVLETLNRQPYDLVLMDVQMPEMDGVAATRQIRQTFLPPMQPIIIALTANALDGDRDEYLQAGMDDYLSKPVRIEALTAALERNFAKSQKAN